MRSSRALLAALSLLLSLPACVEQAPPPTVPVAPAEPAPPGPPEPPPPAPKQAPPPPPAATAGRPAGVPGTTIRFTGGDGSSVEHAILIEGAKGEVDGVRSEYQYLEMLLGPRGTWQRTKQALLEKNGRKYDLLEVEHQGKTLSFYFDITLYFGKM